MSGGIAKPQMIYGLTAAVFLSTLGVGIFSFAIPLLALQGTFSGLLLGATFSGYFLAKLISSPIAGKLADKKGPKPLLVASGAIGLLAPLAVFGSSAPAFLYVVQFCLGLSAGIMKPVATAALAATVAAHMRGRVFGLCNALYNGAFFLAPLLSGVLFYNRELFPVLIALTACMALCLLLFLLCIPNNVSTAPPDSATQPSGSSVLSFRTATLFLAVGGRTACTACLITFYPALLSENLHGPTWLVGLFFALPSVVSFLCLPIGGKLADTFGREALTVVGMVISAAALVIAGQMETSSGFLFAGILLGAGSSLSLPASMALAASLDTQQGRIMGWFHGAANAGFVIGPLLCGILVKWYAAIPLAMATMGALGAITVLPLAISRLSYNYRRSLAITAVGTCLVALMFAGQLANNAYSPAKEAAASEKAVNFANISMGNVVHVTLYGVDAQKGAEVSQAAFDTMAELEADFGHRNSAGAVGRINLSAGVAAEKVNEKTFSLIKRALHIGKMSQGVFDITIGAVTVLPYYYQEKAEIEKAPLVDYRKVVLDEEHHTVFLPEAGMAIDLGGLAKGTVLDGAAATLRALNVPAALVEAGGDLYCYGDREWKVGIQDPRGDGLLGVISVANAGVCGSGDYYQYAMLEENGTEKRKHHILDPDLLDSADQSIAVTVVAPSAELADALATTLFILGPHEGQKLLQHYSGSSALWILPDKSLVTSKGFPQLLSQ